MRGANCGFTGAAPCEGTLVPAVKFSGVGSVNGQTGEFA